MTANLKYVIAPPGWSPQDKNPFSKDGRYGPEWSAFCLLERDDDQFFTGKSGDGPFSARFGRKVPSLEARLADFLRYENRHGRMVILAAPVEIDLENLVREALANTPETTHIRPNDPSVLVHSTTLEAWERIQEDRELKAASQIESKIHASNNRASLNPVEEYLKNEPPEYRDYIMFGDTSTCTPEMVVASSQAGRFLLEENAAYTPGTRLYFDNNRIIQDGRGTRDGIHVMKVFQRLPLEPYLLAAVSVKEIDPSGKVERWTLRSFVDEANRFYRLSLSKTGD
jgi:hypothetical protein